jgi:unsaturated chondroitin disaccharide hydrolase
MLAKTYSVWITPNGGSETKIANNYAFRTGCPATDDVGKLFVVSEAANNLIMVENHQVTPMVLYSFDQYSWTTNGINLGTANTGTRTVNFDATPSTGTVDGSIDYADTSTTVTGFGSLAMQVRFNPAGYFDVRNGGSFNKTTQVNFSANTKYHVRIVANMNAYTYNVYITPNGGSETQIASNYAFRTGCPTTNDIGKLFVVSEAANNLIMVENHVIT